MTKEDLKQIGDLMDTKLEKALKSNNKDISKIIDEKLEVAINDIAAVVNTAFSEFEEKINEKFEKIDERFETVDERFVDLKDILRDSKSDLLKLKFLHMTELKDAPDNLTIISKLEDEGLN
jgi:hypothetical protein